MTNQDSSEIGRIELTYDDEEEAELMAKCLEHASYTAYDQHVELDDRNQRTAAKKAYRLSVKLNQAAEEARD